MVYFLANNGNKPNASNIGSLQGIDNIEAATHAFKLYEAWDEQAFLDNKLAILLGLHDLNTEFSVTDMTANFIKPVMQVGQSLAQSGNNGPSIFPNTSLAARLKYMPTETTYASIAAFDGVPGDPNRPHGTHIDPRRRDGLLIIAEAGCTPKIDGEDRALNKFAVGAWTYTKKVDDLVDVDSLGDPIKRRMSGAYFLSSYQIYSDKKAGHDLGVFFRAGIADGDTRQTDWDYVAGVVGHGWIPSREDGELGFGFSQSHNSDKYFTSVSGVADRSEYGLEAYYRDTIYNGVSIQPDIQRVIDPGTDRVTKDATMVGLRLDVNF